MTDCTACFVAIQFVAILIPGMQARMFQVDCWLERKQLSYIWDYSLRLFYRLLQDCAKGSYMESCKTMLCSVMIWYVS